MRSIEVTGKSVDIAIFSGLQQLGLSIDEVTIETLQTESKGILGIGARPAKVRLTEKPVEEVVVPNFEADRIQRERGKGRERRDEVRGHGRERRDDSREGRGGERKDIRGKSMQDDAENKSEGTSVEPARRRQEKKKPYRNIDEMLAAMGSSVDSEPDENFEQDMSLGEATALKSGGSVYDTHKYGSDSAASFSTGLSSADGRSEQKEQEIPKRIDEPESESESIEQSISSVVREAERYAESMEDEYSRRKTSGNGQHSRNSNYKNNRSGNRQNSKPAKHRQELQSEQRSAMQPEREINYTEEAAIDNPAADFVKKLIEHMGINGKVLAACDEEAVRLRIDSESMGALIGHRGETLDAIQYLTSLVINRNRKEDGYTRITIDTEDYREKREETLTRLAKRVAQQVKNTGRARVLEPMNPYERRILHSALQNNPFVATHSEGEEPNRRVVVTPKRRNRGYGGNNNRRPDRRRFDDRSTEDRGNRNTGVLAEQDAKHNDVNLQAPGFNSVDAEVPMQESITE